MSDEEDHYDQMRIRNRQNRDREQTDKKKTESALSCERAVLEMLGEEEQEINVGDLPGEIIDNFTVTGEEAGPDSEKQLPDLIGV